MNDRYVARVVKLVDDFTIVVNRGANGGLKTGDQFLLIGLGEEIRDPDTKEVLEKLEIMKGRVEVIHAQEKIATLKSCRQGRHPEKKEIRKVTSISKPSGLGVLFGPQDTVTESVVPGETYVMKLEDPKVGDVLVKA